jgi:hypothetical protein
MKEVSGEKYQISASVDKVTVNAIQKLIEAEKRSFSQMVDILLAEALKARKSNLIE